MPHSVPNAERSFVMTTKKQLVRKIIKAKKEIMSQCLNRIKSLLDQTNKLKAENVLERWSVHHNLLLELQLLETMITKSDKNQNMIRDMKDIADDIVPKSGLYT